MPNYTVKGTNILHNKTVFAEGSTIELDSEEAIRLADYLEEIPETKKETKKQDDSKQAKPAAKEPKTPGTPQPATTKSEDTNSENTGGTQ